MSLKRELGGALRAADAGRHVLLQGWVDRRRDHGGLLFVDLRDRAGIVQIVFNPETDAEAHAVADALRLEYVVEVSGLVRRRPEDSLNPNMATGDVEVVAAEAKVLSAARTPPFPINEDVSVDDRVRLRYRYLDLRRERMQRNLRLRARVNRVIRDYLDARDFVEVETPILYKSTPEGARDYLVPSRVHPGEFYALPQSPQTLKQLLMVAGFERYYQIARCFRDEDLRADRQPEFTQLDLEMSFVSEAEIFDLMEPLFVALWGLIGVELRAPFDRLSYAESMRRYGSDKPDRRFGMEIADLTEDFRASGFQVFAGAVKGGGVVRALAVPGGAGAPRREVDAWVDHARGLGARGLAWLPVTDEPGGPVAKYLGPQEQRAAVERTGAKPGDMVIFAAGPEGEAAELLGAMRVEIARRLRVERTHEWDFLWINQVPMFAWNGDDGRLEAMHHPFTRPMDEDLPLFDSEPLKVRASSYDIVCNGTELGSGSLRIFDSEVQAKVFSAIGLDEATAQERFGFFLEALQYGTPPHGGIAPGLDRITALLAGEDAIREVIAFPKTQLAQDLMAETPSPVDAAQLRELGIAVLAKSAPPPGGGSAQPPAPPGGGSAQPAPPDGGSAQPASPGGSTPPPAG
ncbi:MAG TPA: aspartate--tRNA ligase [Candidatus Dormibacteraeota bacterium]|jgi:aspartyl-tRNA synthetase|nr:aspartate--tRNA ligase [Candidatus Dormibacteraeota bacterium]